MKRIISLLLFILVAVGANAQDKTIVIAESNLPYSSQTWFYGGHGNGIQGDMIKKNWDEGRRITSLAYTAKGWFVTMAKNTGIGMQTYKVHAQWPGDWIKENFNEGYRVTALGRSDKEWCVVMSQGSGYTYQTLYRRDSWSELADWYNENIAKGCFLTDVVYDGKSWTVSMSQTTKYASQGYFWAKTYDELVDKVKKDVWGRSYCVHQIVYGEGSYLVVYGNYGKDNARRQSYAVDHSDISGYISKQWDASSQIVYIAGGYTNRSATSGSNARYLGQRTGRFYYISDTNQQATFNFYWNNGDYLVESSTLGMGYGFLPRFILRGQTSDSYIFDQAKVDLLSGRVTVLEGMPQMIVSKGWNRIVLKKAAFGEDMILTKEVSKEEYDKISQAKSNFINSMGGIPNHQHGNGGTGGYESGSSHIDGPCKYCGGGGGCRSCNGTGLKYNPYGGYHDTCPSCNGSGRCFNCRGTGKQATY